MFLKIYLFPLLLSTGFCLNAQTLQLEWVAQYFDVSSQGIVNSFNRPMIDSEKNVYVCGKDATVTSSSSFLFLKYDSLGNFLWQAGFDNLFPDFLNGCVLTATGLIAGGTSKDQPGGGAGRAILISYDEDGGERYLKSVFDPQDYSASLDGLEMDGEGYLYAVGLVCPKPCENPFEENMSYIAKIDPATGEVIWANTDYSGKAFLIKVAGDKLRVLGTTNDSIRFYLREMDFDGNVLYSAFFPDLCGSPSMDVNGDVITTGDLICKMTIAGDTAWSYDYLEGNADFIGGVRNVISDNTGNIYGTGWLIDTVLNVGYTKTVKISPTGALLWSSKSQHSEEVAWEDGRAIALSEDYAFVCSQVAFDGPSGLIADFRPILYSNEDGAVLSDTLIDLSSNDIPLFAAWDGEHFYFKGTFFTGNSSQTPLSIALFKFSIDEPVATKETAKLQKDITVSPNPFGKYFNLLIEAAKSGEATMSVFSPLGQRVHRSAVQLDKGGNNLSIEGTDKWPDGFYFVAIEMEGRTYTEKIVKTD
ncbi:MAG TPA: T9SS type A sorting domain-containing protein [Bacteroidetes bacterium]|nr:T9SS type A sorting domain-containing protein [Bacteroidota bacterium]